ncbi:hypothetical protein MNBD_ALPHA09-320 [hydrothermal vent metagenome]|uniref:Peptidase S49 domain-containing protein n=1 Tax=hydrothermal vent metagenome TaxID=652676 RepID=A0A3B0T048_9ZZZZ
MTLDAHAIADRRRLKRRISLWRLAAIAAVVVGGLALVWVSNDRAGVFGGRAHIAALDITGLITGSREKVKILTSIAKSSRAKALILRIDSPGGTTAGSEVLYEAIRAVAEKKPVVAIMETVAASGGYIVALAADHLVARGNTITGSIGVIFQWAEVNEALASLGIKVDEIKSGPLKATPSMFSETSPEARQVTEAMVRDGYDWFVALVAERRPFDISTARALSDGRIYSGRQAIAARLIDEIGGESRARAWLESEKNLDKGLKIVDWTEDGVTDIDFVSRVLNVVAGMVGLSVSDRAILGISPQAGRRRLDGMLSLWHPQLLN